MSKMKTTIACAILALLTGCSTALHRSAVFAENTAMAGSDAWTEVVYDVVSECRGEYEDGVDQGLTEQELRDAWDACVGPTKEADEEIAKAVRAAVGALRLYWVAAAADDRAGMLAALGELKAAAAQLPDEHFGGLKKILARF